MGESKSVMKRGKTFANAVLFEVPEGHPVKEAKIKDVKCLLDLHYGQKWQEEPKLKFFNDLLSQPTVVEGDQEDDDDFELNDDDEPLIE